ncbi:MAG: DUF3800 domain-containing protein [Bacteroidota bacterium]|nr:DUF3800 domain-containing protein [Bacteroidota bacterium]
MKSLIRKASQWKPKNDSDLECDKKLFLDYLIKNCCGHKNARKIDTILDDLRSKMCKKDYKRGGFQQSIIVPFKEETDFYVGTKATKGIYLVTDAEDVVKALNFYRGRIRSEHKHLRNLKSIAKRHNVLKNITISSNTTGSKKIFFDASGVPSLTSSDKFYIVGALIVNDHQAEMKIETLLNAVKDKYGVNDEIKSNDLKPKEYKQILNKLAKIDYEFAAICFVKKHLDSKGFNYSKSFYKYAYQFLIDNILDYVGEVSFCFDEYGTKGDTFEKEFFDYLKNENFGFVLNKVNEIKSDDSKKNGCLQLVDLLVGTVKQKLKSKNGFDVTPWFEEKIISIQYFPHL